jgi:ribosomal protein S18 acetylase RimI-like enzyme
MSSAEVRRFRRADRDQLTGLVNAHAGAVIPGMSVSVNSVLSQLEREPSEPIVDPWVVERVTLVAEQRGRVVAAAHLLRYADDAAVGECYRGSAELRWFLFWPEAPYWPDSPAAADALMDACLAQLKGWGVARPGADGALPVPGVYGVPEQWPHVRALYERFGFVHAGRIEIVLAANLADIPRAASPPVTGLSVRRSVGINGTRLAAVLDHEIVGYIEVESREDAGRRAQHSGWADIGNLHVSEPYCRQGIGSWLVGQAADWLRFGGFDRVLDYAWPEEHARLAFLYKLGFRELTHTQRGWRLTGGET